MGCPPSDIAHSDVRAERLAVRQEPPFVQLAGDGSLETGQLTRAVLNTDPNHPRSLRTRKGADAGHREIDLRLPCDERHTIRHRIDYILNLTCRRVAEELEGDVHVVAPDPANRVRIDPLSKTELCCHNSVENIGRRTHGGE